MKLGREIRVGTEGRSRRAQENLRPGVNNYREWGGGRVGAREGQGAREEALGLAEVGGEAMDTHTNDACEAIAMRKRERGEAVSVLR